MAFVSVTETMLQCENAYNIKHIHIHTHKHKYIYIGMRANNSELPKWQQLSQTKCKSACWHFKVVANKKIYSYINIYLQHWSARNVGMFLHILPLLPRNCAFCIQILQKHTHTHTHPHTNIRIKTVFAFASCSAIFVWHLLQSFVHPMRQHVANWYFKLVVVCYVGRLLWFGRCCKSIPCVGNFQLHQT